MDNQQKPRPYKGNEPYIFISYSHNNLDTTLDIIARLREDGYRVWFDDGITPGSDWDSTVAAKIKNSGYLIALISKDYLESDNCRDELNYARDINIHRLLIYLENIVLPDGMQMRLGRLQAIHKYKFADLDDFFEKVYETKEFKNCINNGEQSEKKEENAASAKKETEAAPISVAEKFTYLGSYPQGKEKDENTIKKLEKLLKKNRKKNKNANGLTVIEANGKKYTKSHNDWYVFEPIKWRVLQKDSQQAFLLSEYILEAKRFDEDSNNYEKSEIRKWLNDEFYNVAFTKEERERILPTEIDNSAASANIHKNSAQWNGGENIYACDNTIDKVFLVSEKEITNEGYGFSADCTNYDIARLKKTTPYAQSLKLYSGRDWWWLRSPNYIIFGFEQVVYINGRADRSTRVDTVHCGVVPAIKIKLQ